MLKKLFIFMPIVFVTIALSGCSGTKTKHKKSIYVKKPVIQTKAKIIPVVFEKRSPKKPTARLATRKSQGHAFNQKLSSAALGRLRSRVRYDGSYVKIAYPWGDVPASIGVCTDVVIRSYRKLGIDLQKQVHQDMSAAFNTYPNPRKWGLSRPDTNIDHRRVYNLRKFFTRRGAALPITHNPYDYKPGDMVTWMVGPDLPHIGVVVNRRSKADPNRYMIVHNIAEGPKMEDVLFSFPITGHYRYTPAHMNSIPQGVYASRSAPKKNSMSYRQLVNAAKLLGTNTATTRSTKVVAKPVKNTRNPSHSNQIVRLDKFADANNKAGNKSLKLATLSNAELQALIKQ